MIEKRGLLRLLLFCLGDDDTLIQIRREHDNAYLKILDTMKTYQQTYEKISQIPGILFNRFTGEWLFGLEVINELLTTFENQIVWNQPLAEIIEGYEPKEDDEALKKHLAFEANSLFNEFKIKPYPYQQAAAYFLAELGSGAVLDGVGLGKTVSIISTFHLLHKEGKANRCLVVTLSSVVPQWANEIHKFTHYQAIPAKGTNKARLKSMKAFKESEDHQFLIINYEMLRSKEYSEIIKSIPFDMIALDEGHRIKSGVDDFTVSKATPSKVAKSTYEYIDLIPHRFIATATPIQSKPEEAWSLFHFVDPNILGEWSNFRDYFCKIHDKFGITGHHNLEDLYGAIHPYFILRTRYMPDIQQQLPAVRHEPIVLEATNGQKKATERLKAIKEELADKKKSIIPTKMYEHEGRQVIGSEYEAILDNVIQAYTLFLILIANSPQLLMHKESSPFSKKTLASLNLSENEIKGSPKYEYMKNFITENILPSESDKVIIFTQFERQARELAEIAPNNTVMITGSHSSNEREAAIDGIWNNPDIKILIGTAAASTGVNLQKANFLVHYDLPWVSAEIEQRNGRINRTGNTHDNITILYLLMDGLYDMEHIVPLLAKKSGHASMVMTGQEQNDEDSIVKMMKKLQRK